MEEVGQGRFGRSAPVYSVPGTATESAAPIDPLAAVVVVAAAAGLADWLLQLPELADWLGRLRGQRELHGLHWTAAQLQPGAALEPAAATAAAAPATELSTGGKDERREEKQGEERIKKSRVGNAQR